MATSITLTCAIFMLYVIMCRPVQAQKPAIINLEPIIRSGDGNKPAAGSRRTGGGNTPSDLIPSTPVASGVEAVASALRTIGASQKTIDSIAAALPNDSEHYVSQIIRLARL
ncbi:hypothetical protein VOLCADRAFT_87952 [Volvox carteri f. nagariensis]|uniref:Uncharacterized protein n=1 Tax=Volvox carteri f. nagariensis TaxID=3068 RepID=D8TMP0_VOLCA|nr:uncharacterized protein VOLCADRAFT_87952 [Volvox carteri f. nagariensis]EFJ51160.1 hypothetical protein VOLCADRAFT_87952 [Volvox carteri f. nagariensis]|eukprot:XP_002947627.1 hypothetical protein VOLCADRAFT_87952 [Volvox carteri f. nagariensis]